MCFGIWTSAIIRCYIDSENAERLEHTRINIFCRTIASLNISNGGAQKNSARISLCALGNPRQNPHLAPAITAANQLI
jgi:hypothetical protein